MDEVKEIKSVHAKEETKKEETFTFDQNTVMFTIYLLYKANMITRNHLSHMLKIIKETKPELNIAEYLVKEAARV